MARSPTVTRHVSGTCSSSVEAERSRRRQSMSAIRHSSRARCGVYWETDRRMLRICRSTAKQLDTILDTDRDKPVEAWQICSQVYCKISVTYSATTQRISKPIKTHVCVQWDQNHRKATATPADVFVTYMYLQRSAFSASAWKFPATDCGKLLHAADNRKALTSRRIISLVFTSATMWCDSLTVAPNVSI